jgi:hypothetical protein
MKEWFVSDQDDLQIYHFSRIIQVSDRNLSDALYGVDNKDIALALLGSGEAQKFKVLKNVSKKRSSMIQSDIDFYKMTYTKSDCDTSQEKIINAINEIILDIPSQNKIKERWGIIGRYRNRYFTGIYTSNYHSNGTSKSDHLRLRSGWTWVRWGLWLILILAIIVALIVWDKHAEDVWDKASKAGWPSNRPIHK